MSSAQLLDKHPAGLFRAEANLPLESILYLDSMEIKLGLTDYEKSLLQGNGFLVSERLSKESIGMQLLDIWQKDLPIFISTDAILHTFHFAYDRKANAANMASRLCVHLFTGQLLKKRKKSWRREKNGNLGSHLIST